MGFVVLVAVIFAVEVSIKSAVEARCEEGVKTSILKDKVYITRYHNHGAFRGFLQDRPELLKGICIGIIGVCSMIYLLTLGRKGRGLMKFALSLLLGGAFSNFYDRATKGYVVDYFGFNIGNEKLKEMVFNLSDFFIIIGTALAACRVGALDDAKKKAKVKKK